LLEEKMRGVRGVYRPSLLVEVWVALLFYGGRWLDDLNRPGFPGDLFT